MIKNLTYRDAINQALMDEMQRDENVFVYGIGVDDHLRIFGTTHHLVEKFGHQRCFGTPISEDAMTGFGMGAALNGLRPVHIHIRVDFLMLAMNQLSNMLSTHHYGTGGAFSVPMTIRAVIGRGWGQSYQHSKSMQACFAHIPGLKVFMPTTPQDIYSTLAGGIRDNNPVLVLEHRWLYDAVGPVDTDIAALPTAPAVIRPGTDITLVATSWMNIEALQAADVLKEHGIEAEIIDARVVSAFDNTAIVKSVQKTGKCIVIDNDWVYCGFSAELAAQISSQCFSNLTAPVRRIGWAAVPCPCTRSLETVFYSGAPEIIRAVTEELQLPEIDLSGRDFYSHERKFKGPF